MSTRSWLRAAVAAVACFVGTLASPSILNAAPIVASFQEVGSGDVYFVSTVNRAPVLVIGATSTYNNALIKNGVLNTATGEVTGGTVQVVAVTSTVVSFAGNAAATQVSFNFAFGSFSNVSFTMTSNSPGGAARSEIQDTSINLTATANATLLVTISDNGFNLPVGSTLFMSNSNPTGTKTTANSGQVISSQAWFNNSNAYLDTTGQSAGAQVSPDAAGAGVAAAFGTGSVGRTVNRTTNISNFSLTYQGSIGLKAGDTFTVNNDIVVTAIPEPSTAILMVVGAVFGAGGFLRRKKMAVVA